MTPNDIDLIDESFAHVLPIRAQAAQLFYGRLFEIAPEVRPMFKDDMAAQKDKLMTALATVIASLRNLETIVPTIEDLARRHVEYGVKPEHYQPVGAALLWTLEQGLGDGFTPDVREAWSKAYTVLSDTMIGAAYAD